MHNNHRYGGRPTVEIWRDDDKPPGRDTRRSCVFRGDGCYRRVCKNILVFFALLTVFFWGGGSFTRNIHGKITREIQPTADGRLSKIFHFVSVSIPHNRSPSCSEKHFRVPTTTETGYNFISTTTPPHFFYKKNKIYNSFSGYYKYNVVLGISTLWNV